MTIKKKKKRYMNNLSGVYVLPINYLKEHAKRVKTRRFI